jgi:alpha-glucosidase (family GH31 glycosyl hydrolase)
MGEVRTCDEREDEGEALSPEDEEKLQTGNSCNRSKTEEVLNFRISIFHAQIAHWKKHPEKDFGWNKIKFWNVIESVAGGRTQTGKVQLLTELTLHREA